MTKSPNQISPVLTAKELEVLRLVAKGYKNREIAAALTYSIKHVEAMLGSSDPHRSIYAKIGVTTKHEAAAWFAETYGGIRMGGEKEGLFRLQERFVELYTHDVERAYSMRLLGHPEYTIEVAKSLSPLIEESIREAPTPGYREVFLELLQKLLYQEGWAHAHRASTTEVWAFTTGFEAKIQRYKKNYKLGQFETLSQNFLGESYYIFGQHKRSVNLLGKALAGTQDEVSKLKILLTLSKIWGRYLDDEINFDKVKIEVLRSIERQGTINPELLILSYGNLARAQAHLGLGKDAYSNLEQAKAVCHQIKDKEQQTLLREAQVVREEFEVIRALDPTGQKGYLEQEGNQAIAKAQQANCQRLVNLLKKYLQEMLN